jgi:RHS repeat-associated protein
MSDTPAGSSEQQFTWDVASSVPELLEDGTNYYLYGPNVGSAPIEQITTDEATPSYLISDTTGVRDQLDSSGTVTGSMNYSSYGTPCDSCTISTPFGYAGGYTDLTGLVYLVHRFFDPATAQFMSIDPDATFTQTPYAYVGDDPANDTDSNGLCGTLEDILFGPIICGGSPWGALWDEVSSHAAEISNAAAIAATISLAVPGADAILTPALTAISVATGAIATDQDSQHGNYLQASLDALSAFVGAGALPAGPLGLELERAAQDALDAGEAVIALAKGAQTAKTVSFDLTLTGGALAVLDQTAADIVSGREQYVIKNSNGQCPHRGR